MTTSARPKPGPSREYHFPPFERNVLPNGLRVIVAPVRKLPIVTVLAVIDAGAVYDPAGQEGLAQLTAQSLREGTAERDGLGVLEGFERIGSSLETGADWDSILVGMTLLTDRLPMGLELLAEVLTCPIFPEHEVERLKAEQLAERLQILSEPRGLADESFSRFLYAEGSRYSEPMNGSNASITGIRRANVTDFYTAYFTPETVTIIVVGDIDADEGVDFITSALGSWEGNRRSSARVTSSGQLGVYATREVRAIELVAKADVAQAELRFGHAGIPRSHPDYFSVVVMNALLGGLFSSRINMNLREQRGYTYGASSYYDWRRSPGPFVISTAVKLEVTADAITQTVSEIARMRSEKVSGDELSLATSYLEGVFPIRYETTSSIASALANLVIFDLPEDFYDIYRENIRSVTSSDVLEAARRHVQPERMQTVVVGNGELLKGPLNALALGPVSVHSLAQS